MARLRSKLLQSTRRHFR